MSFNKVGDVQSAQGDLAGALKLYNDGFAIADRLTKFDPSNARWQRDLSVSYWEIATILSRSGDKASALDALRKGKDILLSLTRRSPENAEWKRDLDRFEQEITRLGQ